MISQATIDKIYSAVRIEEVIGEYVQLKRAGANLKGLSPFKDEKTPSFVVSPSKNIWKDFSTGKGGNVFTFLKEIENFSYPEALRFLAGKYGIEVEEHFREMSPEELQEKSLRDQLYKIHEVAVRWFSEQLWETEEGKNIALSYLRNRGISDECIKKFQLGYSPEDRDAFAKYAESQGYSREILEKSGLVYYSEFAPQGADRFRERVLFPIQSFSGRTLGFGGRIMKNNTKTAKYINSPETEIYHKTFVLYGLSQARQAISKADVCYLTEGYMDVIAMHQAGIENTVASSGTALTTEQIRLIKRLTDKIVILYDGDEAGIRASFRSIDLILAEGMNVRIVLFPDGHDPDSFSKGKSSEEIQDFLNEQAQDFVEFKSAVLFKNSQDDPLQKAQAIRDIISSVSCIPSPLQREIYIQKIAAEFHLSEQNLYNELAMRLHSGVQKTEKKRRETKEQSTLQAVPLHEEVNPLAVLEERLIELILKYGNKTVTLTDAEGKPYDTIVTEEIAEHYRELDSEPLHQLNRQILKEAEQAAAQPSQNEETFFSFMMDEEISTKLAEVSLEPYQLSNWKKHAIFIRTEEEMLSEILAEVITRHKREKIMEIIKELREGIDKSDDMLASLQKIQKLTALKNKIDADMSRPM